jgi:bifunctional non-homologous end joining protein LigD
LPVPQALGRGLRNEIAASLFFFAIALRGLQFRVIVNGEDPTGVAALYLGKREGKDLVYMGKVGTGWSRTVSSQIRKQLDTVVSPKSKLIKPIRKPRATWVKRAFTAEVEFRDITSEGLLRQSSFKGLTKLNP